MAWIPGELAKTTHRNHAYKGCQSQNSGISSVPCRELYPKPARGQVLYRGCAHGTSAAGTPSPVPSPAGGGKLPCPVSCCSRFRPHREHVLGRRPRDPGERRCPDEAVDRVRIDRTHIAGSIDPVNPVYIYKVEQIHAVDWDRRRRSQSTAICSRISAPS